MSVYVRQETLEQALSLLDTYGSRMKPYAGGTDLMVELRKKGGSLPGVDYFLDVRTLPELCVIERRNGYIYIGAAVSHARIAADSLLRKYAGALCDASGSVGAAQTRNSGTIGGNICNGSLAADTLPALTAMSAMVELRSASGLRRMEISTFHQGKGKLNIRPDELLTGVVLPVLEGYHSAYIKLGRRKALAISRMNVAVMMKQADGVIEDVRIAPGCVFPCPERAFAAEELLRGRAPAEELFAQAGKAVSAQMVERTGVRWSTEYKQPVIETLTVRALRMAAR